MEKLRVGVIGLGMGRHHVEGFRKHPDVEVVAVADLDENRLNDVGDQFGVRGRYRAGEEMLASERLDVVSIATPNKFHKQLTIQALEAGCHVLCEKPMAMSAAEAREMLAAADRLGKRLMINFSYRFTEQSMALKQQVDAGVLGDVYFGRTVWHRRRWMGSVGRWFGNMELAGGGPLIDLGVHRLDLALWLMGYPKPVWVLGSAYRTHGAAYAAEQGQVFDVEDLAAGMIRFENGATLEVEASWNGDIKERELMETRLWGTKGGLVQRNLDEAYKFEAEIYVERNGSHFDMQLHPLGEKVESAMYHLAESIINDTPHTATGEEGLFVMQILDAIYASAREGRPIAIESL